MKNKWVIIGIIVVLALLAGVIAKKSGWIGDSGKKKVAVEEAKRRTIVQLVSASGKVQPETELKISSDVSGEIVDLAIKEGQVVKKGDLLAKIKPDIYASDLDRARASLNTSISGLAGSKSRLEQAQSQADKAKTAYDRAKQLFDDKVISQQDFETARSAYEVAKAEVDAAKQNIRGSQFGIESASATVKQAQENLNKTAIYAPVDGTISSLSKRKGERVVGTNMMDGTEIMRLANLNEMEVVADVSEADIIRVHLNDTAEIEIDAYNDRTFTGIVTEIANTANTNMLTQSTDQVTNYTVKIRILRSSYEDLIPKDNPNMSPFRPGMSASVDVKTTKVIDVISVPIQCVTTRDTTKDKKSDTKKFSMKAGEENKEKKSDNENATATDDEKNIVECLYIIKENKAERILVKTGIQDNNYIEIKSGLIGNEKVITKPYVTISKLLENGDDIEVVDEKELFEGEEK